MNIQTITLDISKRSAVTPVLYLRQGDKSGTQLRVNVMRDGAAFPLGGYGVRFEMRAPKDRGYYECTGSANGNVATFTIDETYAAAFPGVTDVAYVRILEGSTVIASTGNFRVVIHEDGTEGADPNGAYTNGVTKWLANAQQSLMNMENAANAEVDSAIDRLDDAVSNVDGAVSRANAAAAAAEGVVVDAVPLMSKTVHGGAKLGHGLRVSAGALGVQLVESGSGTGTVQADGDYLHALEVDGKSEQRTTTGKNLINGPNVTMSGAGDFVPWHQVNLPAGTYTLSVDSSITSGAFQLLYNSAAGDSGQTIVFTQSWTSNHIVKSFTVDAGMPYVKLFSNTAGTFTNIQLEAGSTATAYEPYTGGKASPSPDYPQEVRTVKGINLLNNTASSITVDGVTFTVNADKSITVNGTSSKTSGYTNTVICSSIDLPAGTYTLSGCPPSGNESTYFIQIRSVDDSPHIDVKDSGIGKTFSLTQDASAAFIRIVVMAGKTVNNLTFYPQLEAGTTAHDFVPYGALGLKVRGKNRLNHFKSSTTNNVRMDVAPDGTITLNGTASGNANFTVGISVSAGTYTMSVNNPVGIGSTTSNSPYVFISASDGTWLYSATLISPNRVVTATSSKDAVYLSIVVPSGVTVTDFVMRIQLEAGSTATEYAPYVDGVTPIPLNGNVLASLPDGTHDELTVDDAGHVVLNKQVKMFENLGSIMTGYDATSLRFYSTSITDIAAPTNTTTQIRALCTHVAASTYSSISASSGQNNVMGAFASGGTKYFAVKATAYADRSSLQAALADAILYYATTDPQTIDLGYIDMPKLSEGSTIELLASIDPPIDAEWWAVGAGAVHEAVAAQSERIAALESAIAELATS